MNKLLSQKHLSASQKLILLLIMDWNTITVFDLTSQEIANRLGLKRTQILEDIGALEEIGYIQTEVSYRRRLTKLTDLFKTTYNNI